jgi:tRNA pseudouridine32 synthase/23S rRNA pseudouridine746 synthase
MTLPPAFPPVPDALSGEDLRPGRPPPPRRPEPGVLEAPLRLVHVETHLLVADKPAGLLCVPGRGAAGADCLAARVQAQVPDALTVHRLDLATSGLVLMARSAAMLRLLNLGFEQRRMHKRYVAVVAGLIAADSGSIDAPMTVDWMRRPLQKICPVDGRPALTHWRVLARDAVANTTRVELEPVTGRSHQLRLHLAVIGHPILGDELYAPPELCAAAPRLLLHAAVLAFIRPALDDAPPAELRFSSPVPF